MFSLIITIISIALVAALALATLYYGGAAFTRGHADAQAAKVRNQSQQLLGANELFKVNHGRYALNVAELVSADYLKSAPVARAAVQAALADSAWFMPLPGESLFLLETNFPEACRSINEDGYGKRAILPGVLEDIQVQCYGPSTAALYSMAAKDPRAVEALLNAAPEAVPVPIPVVVAAVPTSDTDELWVVPPGEGTLRGGSEETPDNGNGGGAPDTGNGGSTPTGVLTPYSSTLGMGTTTVGTPRTEVFTFQNSGTGAMTLTALNFSATQFSATANECTGALAAGASCSVTVQYAPTAVGSHAGTMTLVGSSDSSSVNLTGSATAPEVGVLNLTSAPAGFQGVQVGQTDTQTVTVSNTGTAAFSFTSAPSILGGDGKFTLASTCGTSIAPGQSCTLTVTFAPTNTTPTSGSLTFDTNVSEPTSLSLTGTGVAAPVGAGAWSADYFQANTFSETTFPSTTVGATATAKTLYLRNSGAGTLSAAFTLTGSDAAQFQLTTAPVLSSDQAGIASCGASLTGAGTGSTECLATVAHPNIKVTLTYSPTAAGSHSVQLVATSANDSTVPGPLTFSATAVEPLPAGYVQYQGKVYSVPRSGSWNTALANCASTVTLWGQTGWHLATLAEIETLRSAGRRVSNPLVALPAQWTVSRYWSANAHSGDANYKLSSNFSKQTTTIGTVDQAGGVEKLYYVGGANATTKYSCVKAI